MKGQAKLNELVTLVDVMGSDLSVVNAARVSFGKQKDALDDSDIKLIRYLAANNHTSPFRHAYLTFHIRAPFFVARQWAKHQVGCAWNEISGRYVEFEHEVFHPEWRSSSDKVKQGSGSEVGEDIRDLADRVFHQVICESKLAYNRLINLGVCREHARLVLPMAQFTEWYWTASLQAVAHFLKLRLDEHSQKEIRDYAKVVEALAYEYFPHSLEALVN